jgi:hypothetical protein
MEHASLLPPFFVIDGHDVMFCRSLQGLCTFVEPIDAPNTTAYDSTGRLLKLRTAKRQPMLCAVATPIVRPELLERTLKQFFRRVDSDVDNMQLSEIVGRLDRFGVHYSG